MNELQCKRQLSEMSGKMSRQTSYSVIPSFDVLFTLGNGSLCRDSCMTFQMISKGTDVRLFSFIHSSF